AATALVTASRDEGFGIPLIEAMAAGTPVVCSGIPVFHEIGRDAALYAHPGRPEDFARAVRQLERPGEWEARSRAARERAEHYTWDSSARVLLELIESVVR